MSLHLLVYPLKRPTAGPAGKAISISGADKDSLANNHCPAWPCESNEDRCDANDREVAEISRSTDDNRLAGKDKTKDKDPEREHQRLLSEQEPGSEEQSFRKQKVSARTWPCREMKSLAGQLM